jgi:PKD repeat protein
MKTKILQVFILLQMIVGTAYAQSISHAEYFVGADPGAGNGIPVVFTPGDTVEVDFSINMDILSPGWHTLSIRARDELGRWVAPVSKTFYVYESEQQTVLQQRMPLIRAEYFFNTDPGPGNGIAMELHRSDTVEINRYINISSLDTGSHILYFRAMDEYGIWSLSKGVAFHIDTTSCNMPLVDFSYDTVTYGTPVTFVNHSENIHDSTTFSWDINNNGIIDYTTQHITHVFPYPGIYEVKLTVENDSLCNASIIKDVIAGPLPSTEVLVNGLLEFCSGDSVIFTSQNDPLTCTFEWSDGKTTRAITVRESGTYNAWVTNQYGMTVKSMVFDVLVHDTLYVQLYTEDATGGNSNGMAMLEISGGSGNYNILWSNNETTTMVNFLTPGNHWVIIDDGHCPDTLEFVIGNIPVEPGHLVLAEYFFNQDPGIGLGTPMLIRAGDTISYYANISIAGLAPGFHELYVRTSNDAGLWSMTRQTRFYISDTVFQFYEPIQPTLLQAEYFLNTDPGTGKATQVMIPPNDTVEMNFAYPVDIPPGFHRIYFRVADEDGKWSQHANRLFYVFDPVHNDLQKSCKFIAGAEYFFNTDPGTGNGIPLSFNIYDTVDIERYFSVASLDTGYHQLYVRVRDEHDNWSLWKRETFHIHHVDCTCPEVYFTADTMNVLGNPTTFLNLSQNVYPDATYQWDADNNGMVDYTTQEITHVFADYGIYNSKLSIFNTDSCFASWIAEVVVSPVVDTSLLVLGETEFCEGDSVIIMAQPGYSYNWNSDQTSQSIVVKQSGSFQVRLTNEYGVQGFSRAVNVLVHPVPEVSLTLIHSTGGIANGTAICEVMGGSGNYTYTWSTGGTLPIENNLPEGNHFVIVDDGYCPVQIDFYIENNPVYPGDIVFAEYFFNDEPGLGNGLPLNIAGGDSIYFATYLPVGNLAGGFHKLHIRVKDNLDKWSHLMGTDFYVYEPGLPISQKRPPLLAAEYFFNTDPGLGNGIPISVNQSDSLDIAAGLSVAGLAQGFHHVFVRAMDSLMNWSLHASELFYVHDTTYHDLRQDSRKILAAEYFFNTDPGPGNAIPIDFSPREDSISLERYFSVAGLEPGSHDLFIRVKDDEGKWSIYKSQSFEVLEVLCDSPQANFSFDVALPGNPTSFTNLSSNTYPWTIYQWDINNNGIIDYTSQHATHNFGVSGLYEVKLTVINSDTCRSSVIQQIAVGPLPDAAIFVIGNTDFCKGDSVILSASPGLSYEWWPGGETTQTITVKSSGTYYVWVSTSAGIEARSDAVHINKHGRPVLSLITVNASGGNNGSAWVEVEGGSGFYSYLWSTGDTTFYVNNLAPGSHNVIVDDGHCPVDTAFLIEEIPVEPGNIILAEYFINEDPGLGSANPLNIAAGDEIVLTTGIPVLDTPPGFNRLYIRVKDTDNRWSFLLDRLFYVYDTANKFTPKIQPPLSSAEYFVNIDPTVNPDPGVGMGTPVAVNANDTISEVFGYPVDSLILGFHQIFVRAADDSSKWSNFKTALFYIYDTTHFDLAQIQPEIVAAEYFFDVDPGPGNGTSLTFTTGNIVEWTGGP